MERAGLSVVTGAFGYTGKYITRRLLSLGSPVKTLTGHASRPNPFGAMVPVAPLDFGRPAELAGSLEGAATLYNTYWIRFESQEVTFEQAVKNTRTLIRAAEDAGVRRIVHISITNASSVSPLPYFRAKGLVEEAVAGSSLTHAIIRPTIIFGEEDILINNIAWALRRFPLFPIFGGGDCLVQPVYVEDVARMAVEQGARTSNATIDALGPETYTFEQLVRTVAKAVDSRATLFRMRPGLALFLTRLVGMVVRDVVLTRDEVEGLIANLLVSDQRATGETLFSDWTRRNAHTLGAHFASEMDRHYR